MDYVLRTLIVPDALVAQARALCETLAGPAGAGMFPRRLADADEGIWWLSSGTVGEDMAALLDDPAVMHAACEAAGLDLTPEQCQQILGACVIVPRVDVPELLDSLGLVFADDGAAP
ncbi:hypothetical protein [Pseudacidovorax intermedius]|uniref:hypothetical protein n=1 Tax=Pseudacidovorax intermedius TaxID=433924 RepID=UPI0026E96792|nr:hypothetical protein [Pseudacidovorax intermedius]